METVVYHYHDSDDTIKIDNTNDVQWTSLDASNLYEGHKKILEEALALEEFKDLKSTKATK